MTYCLSSVYGIEPKATWNIYKFMHIITFMALHLVDTLCWLLRNGKREVNSVQVRVVESSFGNKLWLVLVPTRGVKVPNCLVLNLSLDECEKNVFGCPLTPPYYEPTHVEGNCVLGAHRPAIFKSWRMWGYFQYMNLYIYIYGLTLTWDFIAYLLPHCKCWDFWMAIVHWTPFI